MSSITVKRTINAPVSVVFDLISNIEHYAKAIPQIVHVEIVSEIKQGVGVRFRETRKIGNKEVSEEMEVTEFVENDRIRIVCDSHGTVWDSVFKVTEQNGSTQLELTMHAKAYKWFSRIMNFLMKKLIASMVAKDMDAVKEFCESPENNV